MRRFVLLATLLLSACAPSPEAVQTAIARTQESAPTATATSTPAPTEAPVGDCLTNEEYVAEFSAMANSHTEALLRIAGLLAAAHEDSSLLYNSDWKAGVEQSLYPLEELANRDLYLRPPRSLLKADRELKLVGLESLSIIEIMRAALATEDYDQPSFTAHTDALYVHLDAAGTELQRAVSDDDSCP